MSNNNEQMSNKYDYNKSLHSYLEEKYEIEQDRWIKKQEGSKSTVTDNKTIRYNDEKKVRILDNQIFESMANLIHFFEYVNFHSIKNVGDVKPMLNDKGEQVKNEKGEVQYELRYKNDDYLKGKFDDDVKDLFGIRGQHLKFHYENDARYVAFSRLIDGFLNYQNREIQMELITMLGDILIKRIRNLGMAKDWDLGLNIINQDLGRMSFWVKYCTAGVKSDLTESRRKITF
jgi:hypothetical protein